MTSSADDVIEKLAEIQVGVVTRAQLLEGGVTRETVAARVRAGWFRPVHRGVYVVGPLMLPRAREMAAVLACGRKAVLSDLSAAALWTLVADPDVRARVDVTIGCGDRGRGPGIRVHRVSSLRPGEVTRLDVIPVTTPARTLLDVAGVLRPREVEQAFARADREHLIRRPMLLSLLPRYPGRPGTPVLRLCSTPMRHRR